MYIICSLSVIICIYTLEVVARNKNVCGKSTYFITEKVCLWTRTGHVGPQLWWSLEPFVFMSSTKITLVILRHLRWTTNDPTISLVPCHDQKTLLSQPLLHRMIFGGLSAIAICVLWWCTCTWERRWTDGPIMILGLRLGCGPHLLLQCRQLWLKLYAQCVVG